MLLYITVWIYLVHYTHCWTAGLLHTSMNIYVWQLWPLQRHYWVWVCVNGVTLNAHYLDAYQHTAAMRCQIISILESMTKKIYSSYTTFEWTKRNILYMYCHKLKTTCNKCRSNDVNVKLINRRVSFLHSVRIYFSLFICCYYKNDNIFDCNIFILRYWCNKKCNEQEWCQTKIF